MDLFQVLLNIHRYSDDEMIYAVPPWTLESDAKVFKKTDEKRLSIHTDHSTFQYFLEVFIVKEILEELHQNLCDRDQCQHVIEYVINET